METRDVYVESEIFCKEETGYKVLVTREKDLELVVVGTFHGDVIGEMLRLRGEMVFHQSYGMQFKISSYEIISPTDAESIRRYLASGAIKGIGEKMAARIVEAFGDDALRIMEEEPERLAEIKGISLRKAHQIGVTVEEKKDVRSGLMFLQQYHIPNKLALKIYDYYKNRVYSVIKENPYQMVEDIEGVGFLTADHIAQAVGIEKSSEYRIRCGILYVLQNELSEGNTCMPTEKLLGRTGALLETERKMAECELSNLAMTDHIRIKQDMVWNKAAYYAEMKAAKLLLEHNWKEEISRTDALKEIEVLEKDRGYRLDPLQKEAILKSLSCGVLILTGGPGTGKTTTINTMIDMFIRQGKELVLAAPTGRAAKRMSEATGYEARTLHRLLEVRATGGDGAGMFEKNEDNPIEADVVIVDEVSMVDIFLFHALIRALPQPANLILVGDPDQLPSVGPGQVLSDLLKSGLFESICLEKIFRQEDGSDIVMNAHRIQQGEMIRLDNQSADFFFLPRSDVGKIQENILTLVTRQLPRHLKVSAADIQVLTPVRKGALGVENLNELLQKYINPPADDKSEYQLGDKLLRLGDKVMQVKNDYNMQWEIRGLHGIVIESGEGVFNGDIGVITEIREWERSLIVRFDDDREVNYTYEQAENLELAYAMTIHKSQGSEYPAVIIPLLGVPRQMEYRNLLYTAVSRARRCVTLIGEREVIETMIRNENRQQRYTGLADDLKEIDKGMRA